MKDTLQTAIVAVKQTSNDTLEILSKVDTFYNSAWDKLLVTAAIFGVVIPILIQVYQNWLQNKQLKLNEEDLKKVNALQILEAKTELLKEINSSLTEKLIEFQSKIDKLEASSHGKLFQLQGNYFSDKNGEVIKTIYSYTHSLGYFLKAEEWENLQTLLVALNSKINSEVTLEVIENIKDVHNADIWAILDDILSKDKTQLLRDEVLKLKNCLPKK